MESLAQVDKDTNVKHMMEIMYGSFSKCHKIPILNALTSGTFTVVATKLTANLFHPTVFECALFDEYLWTTLFVQEKQPKNIF